MDQNAQADLSNSPDITSQAVTESLLLRGGLFLNFPGQMCHFPRHSHIAKRLLGITLLASLLHLGGHAQPSKPLSAATSPAQLDPSDLYLQGYLSARDAEKLEAKGDHVGAAEKYRIADEFFDTIRKYYPDWRSDMVKRRSAKTDQALTQSEGKAEKQINEQRSVVAELEGGSKVTGELSSRPGILRVDAVASRRLKEAQAEVQRLQLMLEQEQQNTADIRQQQITGSNQAFIQLQEMQKRSAAELAAAKAEIQRLHVQVATHNSDKLGAEKLKAQLEIERTKIARLQREAALLREQSTRMHLKGDELTENQLSHAKAEIQRLKREAAMAQMQSDAEIKRLQRISGQLEAESQEKIQQYQDLAKSAAAHAQQEAAKLAELNGAKLAAAKNNITRLQAIAQQAKADAAKELEIMKSRTSQENSEAQEQINKLRQLALEASRKAEAKQLEYELNDIRSRIKIKELQHDNDKLQVEREKNEAKLLAAKAEVQRLKAQLAEATVESEVDNLNLRIKDLEQEREAMALTLHQSRTGYAQAITRIKGLETDLREARQKSADLSRDLIGERDTANAVVAGQRRQIQQMQKLLDEKSQALIKANDQIARLQIELEQSRDLYHEMRNERDALMMERDQMAALLKLSEAGRVQDLIEQNIGLAKKLREANEALDRMQRDSHSDKDAITEALRDLAIAKSQINRLRQEKQNQEQRILDLEQRLHDEGRRLAVGETSLDPQEVALLRDIIRRQLRAQIARRQTRKLLMDAIQKLSHEDEQISEAFAMMESEEMLLSPEEQKLIASHKVDDEFIAPFSRDRDTVNQATAGLKRDIEVFDRAAKKAFASGRLHPTRELYEMILDQHPGHGPTLCKIGVVQLKLGNHLDAADAFQRAIEMESANAYALRMLSYALMKGSKHHEAEAAARRSVEIEPNDAKTHMLLATLCFRLGKAGDAESHFKGAINADPLPSEPYYNLALICSGSGRTEQAKQYYRQALERGALPDPKLEKELAPH